MKIESKVGSSILRLKVGSNILHLKRELIVPAMLTIAFGSYQNASSNTEDKIDDSLHFWIGLKTTL